MKIKKYKAPSLQEAMKHIRQELGHDAVILNSKVVYSGGFFGLFQKKNIEVIAGVDSDVHKRSRVEPFVEKKKQIKELEHRQKDSFANSEKLSIYKEMEQIKQLVESLHKSDKKVYPTELLPFAEQLKSKGIESNARSRLMMALLEAYFVNGKKLTKEEHLDVLKNELHKMLEPISFHGITRTKKYINVIGPTGVGKTTTLAKLAAEIKIKHKKSIAFITTDTYRIAAIEQLKTYATILNAPVEVCYNANDFLKAKTKLNAYDVVFIDTAGRNFMEMQYVKDLQEIIDFKHDMETFLVFSLTSKYEDMVAIYEQFKVIPIHQFIFTKYDETSSHGAMFNLVLKTNIGCGYITDGQDVPDDIHEMNTKKFGEWVLR
ncbi:flagellar biosynthesis protein FlhF [Bacillus sp. FJAT-47783]|uniref:flagellar biosynthesis protein FlhF n=1 Tax=Bacillus sp. FJAT-47783 TaxID=2922712 RepID=UPI001FABD291|nr:flagellar biosynthesis protein FlhF [Bacillus sp. FJAT-47783]